MINLSARYSGKNGYNGEQLHVIRNGKPLKLDQFIKTPDEFALLRTSLALPGSSLYFYPKLQTDTDSELVQDFAIIGANSTYSYESLEYVTNTREFKASPYISSSGQVKINNVKVTYFFTRPNGSDIVARLDVIINIHDHLTSLVLSPSELTLAPDISTSRFAVHAVFDSHISADISWYYNADSNENNWQKNAAISALSNVTLNTNTGRMQLSASAPAGSYPEAISVCAPGCLLEPAGPGASVPKGVGKLTFGAAKTVVPIQKSKNVDNPRNLLIFSDSIPEASQLEAYTRSLISFLTTSDVTFPYKLLINEFNISAVHIPSREQKPVLDGDYIVLTDDWAISPRQFLAAIDRAFIGMVNGQTNNLLGIKQTLQNSAPKLFDKLTWPAATGAGSAKILNINPDSLTVQLDANHDARAPYPISLTELIDSFGYCGPDDANKSKDDKCREWNMISETGIYHIANLPPLFTTVKKVISVKTEATLTGAASEVKPAGAGAQSPRKITTKENSFGVTTTYVQTYGMYHLDDFIFSSWKLTAKRFSPLKPDVAIGSVNSPATGRVYLGSTRFESKKDFNQFVNSLNLGSSFSTSTGAVMVPDTSNNNALTKLKDADNIIIFAAADPSAAYVALNNRDGDGRYSIVSTNASPRESAETAVVKQDIGSEKVYGPAQTAFQSNLPPNACSATAHEFSHNYLLDEYVNSSAGYSSVSLTASDVASIQRSNLQIQSDFVDNSNIIVSSKIRWTWPRISKVGILLDVLVPVTGTGGNFAYEGTFDTTPSSKGETVFKESEFIVIRSADLFGANSYPIGKIIAITSATKKFKIEFSASLPDECLKKGALLIGPRWKSATIPSAPTSNDWYGMIHPDVLDLFPTKGPMLSLAGDKAIQDFNSSWASVKFSIRPRLIQELVGLWAGGLYFERGIFHGSGFCLMRNATLQKVETIVSTGFDKGALEKVEERTNTFCPVCRYILVDSINPLQHPAVDNEYQKIYPKEVN